MRYVWFAMASLALAAEFPEKAFPDWSDDTVRKVLTDSAWSRGKTVKLEWVKRDPGNINLRDIPGALHAPANANQSLGPLGGIGRGKKESLPNKADILIRWPGSLPLRQATALYRIREEKLDAGKLNELIGAPETYAVVELFGVPAEIAHQGTSVIEDIVLRSATLQFGNAKPIRPVKVEAKLQALTMNVRILFARTPEFSAKSGDIEIYADLQIFSVREKFRLSQMQYRGRAEI
ncbi:MAG: hypothetical protein NTV52_18845 [Acidobacteria bacterium]|nr:hypothetical protein [Acidobacteriota bacterium]